MNATIWTQGIRERGTIFSDVELRDRVVLVQAHQQVVQTLWIDLPAHFCQVRAFWLDNFRTTCVLPYNGSVIVIDTQKIEGAGNHLCISRLHFRSHLSQPGEHIGGVTSLENGIQEPASVRAVIEMCRLLIFC